MLDSLRSHSLRSARPAFEVLMHRRLPFALALAVLLTVPAASARAEATPWRGWDAGMKAAGANKRFVMVDVYTDWCGWCKRMDRDVFSNPEVREYLGKKFVTVRLNAEAGDAAHYEGKDFTSRTLATRFGVTGYPTTIFLRANGDHLANVPGYLPADRFLLLLRYIGDGALDRGVTFDEFTKSSAGGSAK